MFSVVAMKSRTFSSFSYSANEQVCRSWEGAEPDSPPKLANGIIPYHRSHAQFIKGSSPGDKNLFFLLLVSLSHFHGFQSSLSWEFELFWEFGLFWEFCETCKIHDFRVPRLLLEHWLQISHQAVRKLYYV